jgi:hypothetical protein
MANQRKRIGPLDTAGSVAVENESLQGTQKGEDRASFSLSLESDPHQSESNLSFDAEKRIQQLEALLDATGNGKVIQLKQVQGGSKSD